MSVEPRGARAVSELVRDCCLQRCRDEIADMNEFLSMITEKHKPNGSELKKVKYRKKIQRIKRSWQRYCALAASLQGLKKIG